MTASQALNAITGHSDLILTADTSDIELGEIETKWTAWWGQHEADVRARLKVPK